MLWGHTTLAPKASQLEDAGKRSAKALIFIAFQMYHGSAFHQGKKCGFDFIVAESQTPCNVLLEAAWIPESSLWYDQGQSLGSGRPGPLLLRSLTLSLALALFSHTLLSPES